MPRRLHLTSAFLLTLSGAALLPAQSAEAAGATDVTAAVLAGSNVTLSGPSIIDLPSGTTTYNGVFSGMGTLTIAGSGTLVLTKDSDFTLPSADRRQSVTTSGGNWPYPIVSNPDQPAVIVERGATLQYGTGGQAGIIGDYPYTSISGLMLNHDNIEVDGTLDLDISGREFNLGTITGSGTISQPKNMWGTLDLADDIPFAGTIADGTGFNFGSAAFRLSLPSAASVHNDGSAIISARNYTLTLPEDFYEDQYGSDINFHTWQAGLIEMTGVDHYIDTSLDTASIAHTSNFRGINIEGANVQWGDGTTDRFFLPATPSDSYINIHKNGSLTFDYDGPVTLDTPISGGVYHASLSTPANASIALAPTSGNAVTFAVPMNYHGDTTIGRGATLLLGTGTAGGDSSLLTSASNDHITDNGTLTVRNTSTAITLANISGSGGLTQSGLATTTLSRTTDYTGPTTISSGTLAVGPGASGIGSSSGVSLTGTRAVLEIAAAGQSVKQLSGVAGSTVALGGNTLSIGTSGATTYAGSITGTSGGVTTTGSGTLTLTGHASTPTGTWHVQQGTLAIGASGSLSIGSLIQSAGSTLAIAAGTSTPVTVAGAIQLGGSLKVTSLPPVATGGKIVLIHETGTQAVSGAFTGLPQGAKLLVEGHQYTIDYAGGSGHDVVLAAGAAASPSTAGGSSSGVNAADSGGGTSGSGGSSVFEFVGAVVAAAAVALGGWLFFKRGKNQARRGSRRRRERRPRDPRQV
ncbi:autotransporter-associated beta strand repeat-containing protein [Actinospica sp. MGRD01-02]|uniref:Autotransporter-associated beta strand repeat-containing protein n=1 Tax=Actinospica acidithermotolerans TaxID=2828514 RepID=A0A941EHW0_9ACTN|nr:autotransporter-associated beta strand repeat-containing protein [Actinospica acidithermotolerans]MBR7829404.1 autotransporter-associated beta strand repeat-containing protein [Actinospica acidithermotolerans]